MKLQRLQQTQQQMEYVAGQRNSIEAQLRETELALEEIDTLGDDHEVYKSVGAVLIKATVPGLKTDLGERKSKMEERVDNLKKQEERVKKVVDDMRNEIQGELGGGPDAEEEEEE
jgi:prefoldin beta subunit